MKQSDLKNMLEKPLVKIVGPDQWPEIVKTPSEKVAEEFARSKLADGSYRYCKPQYDTDIHEFILIKARPRVKVRG